MCLTYSIFELNCLSLYINKLQSIYSCCCYSLDLSAACLDDLYWDSQPVTWPYVLLHQTDLLTKQKNVMRLLGSQQNEQTQTYQHIYNSMHRRHILNNYSTDDENCVDKATATQCHEVSNRCKLPLPLQQTADMLQISDDDKSTRSTPKTKTNTLVIKTKTRPRHGAKTYVSSDTVIIYCTLDVSIFEF